MKKGLLTLLSLLSIVLYRGHASALQDIRTATIAGYVAGYGEFIVVAQSVDKGYSVGQHTDARGGYTIKLPPGRYKLILLPKLGFPLGEEHASFGIKSGEKVTINFRPIPMGIASGMVDGEYRSHHEGDVPYVITYFIPQS